MIDYRIQNNWILWESFKIDDSGLGIIGPDPDATDYPAFVILQELASMAKAGMPGEFVHIDAADLYSYSNSEGQDFSKVLFDLGFPDIYDGPIYLQSVGALATRGFTLNVVFPEVISRLGAYGDRGLTNYGFKLLSRQPGVEYSCSPGLYYLLRNVKEFNERSEYYSNDDEALLAIARIMKQAFIAGAVLDHVLSSENILEAGKIKLGVMGDDSHVSIRPEISVEGQPEGAFTSKFEKRISVDGVYNFDTNRGRIRLVMSEHKKRALRRIKKDLGNIRDPKALQELLSNPPQEFDDADVDISELYSDRVKALGIYRPRTYPFICPYETEWIPGIMVDGLDGKKPLLVKDRESLIELEKAIEASENLGLDYVSYHGEKIDLESAKVVRDQAANRLEAIVNKSEVSGDRPKVLIIEENVDALNYVEGIQERPIEEVDCAVPGLAPSIELKVHQKEGIDRLAALYRGKYPGAIVADDMGLGKTLQALCFLESMAQGDKGVISCIVAPLGLIGVWIEEYRRSFPEGTLRLKNVMGDPGFIQNILQRPDDYRNSVMLFSYESLRRNQVEFCKINWDIAILDEAQRIKTPGTLVTNAAKALKANFKVAMTGTPVENTFHDLWCIADFCIPGFLSSAKDFAAEYNPAKDDSDDEVKAKGEKLRKRLGKRFLRRIKNDVLSDLPPKYESDNPGHANHFSSVKTVETMPHPQRTTYDNILNEYRIQKSAGSCGRHGMLDVLFRLKSVCEHPLFVEPKSDIVAADSSMDSAKVLSLFDILDFVKQRCEKAIVFAEYRRTQRFLATIIHGRYGIRPSVVNGDTPPGFDVDAQAGTRLGIVRDFNNAEGFGIVIMSPVAAGVGLTVTGANHVIHFSRHWNPSKEDQATDRAYRIGQTRPVYVYYLIAHHPDPRVPSFDDNLARLLFAKRGLRGAVLYPSERSEIKPEDVLEGVI